MWVTLVWVLSVNRQYWSNSSFSFFSNLMLICILAIYNGSNMIYNTSMSYLAYKTKLKLNNQQKTLMRQCAGYGRWVWNWALNFKQKAYKEDIRLNKSQLRKYYTNYVKPKFPWQSSLSSRIYQYVFIDLDEAYKRFFKGIAKHPRFKKKGKSSNSFTIDAGGKPINLGGKLHKFPFFGWLKTHEKLPICSTKKIKHFP